MRMCKLHTLASTAQIDLLCREVDLLLKQVNLLSTSHFYIDLQQLEMINNDENDTGGAMAAHTRSANSAMERDFTKTRQITSCTRHISQRNKERENERKRS